MVYLALAVYASLYPLEGWRSVGLSPFAYLASPWPRYVTSFDLAVNVVGYLPFGFLAVAALHPRLRGAAAFAAAVAGGTALSLLLEAGQSYLPSRFASNLDVLTNVAGAALGALLGLRYAYLLAGGPLERRRAEAFLPGVAIDWGLVLVGLWLFIQLNPVSLLFGAGDLRDFVAPFEGKQRRPEFFVFIEAFTTAANLVALGLLLSALTPPARAPRGMLVALVLAGLAVKTAAFAILMQAENVLAWLTYGAQIGLAAGIALAFAALELPPALRLALAGVLIMAATVFVNLAPANPYFGATLKVWQQGHFLNFNGLTRLVSALWPFATLGYLMFLASRRLK